MKLSTILFTLLFSLPSHLLSIGKGGEEIQAQVKEVDWSPGEDEDCACTNQETVSPPPSARLTRQSGGIGKGDSLVQLNNN